MSRIQLPFAILFLIVSVLFFAPNQTATAQNVNIPDANLREALEKELGKNAGDAITQAEMARVTSIFVTKSGIRNLTGLEFATNLTSLDLWDSDISDISALQGLVKLTWLSLSWNAISDISPLQGLVNLRTLWLRNNQISDISPLQGLVNLTDLVLSGNEISDISPLQGLVKLTDLVLSGNEISDISPLQGLVKLTELRLEDNRISDFSPIAGLIGNLDKYDNSNQTPNPSWDVNEDGKVDILDLTAVSQNFGTAAPASPRTDVNGDGTVDVLDLVAVARHFGESTKPSATTPGTCFVGMTLKPGESCRYNGFTFKVQQNGRCVTIRGINACAPSLIYNQFSASKNGDGTWTINGL